MVVDWKKVDTPFGPKKETRVPKEIIQGIAEKLGYVLERSLETGPYHYWLEFIRKK